MNRNALFLGGIRPHHYCLPVLKREEHREALVEAATSGNPKFFLGTDSAPHARRRRRRPTAAAPASTPRTPRSSSTPIAFEEAGALDKLEGFASEFGAQFYGLPLNRGHASRWCAQDWRVPETPALRRRGAGAAARRRDDSLEARPSASGLRRRAAVARAARRRSLDAAERARRGARTARPRAASRCASCRPAPTDAYYEIKVFETGRVADPAGQPARPASTRSPGSPSRAPRRASTRCTPPRSRASSGRRGRLRDLLTIFDEGGAIVELRRPGAASTCCEGFAGRSCSGSGASACCASMQRARSSATRCSSRRSSRGPASPARRSSCGPARTWTHARAGVACARCAAGASPRDLRAAADLRLSGLAAGQRRAAFYDDERYFRPLPARPAVKSRAGVGQAAAVREAQRKVRAPQSGMQGNSLARRRDEEGHRDESRHESIGG